MAARPILAWLKAREPGVQVRSISIQTGSPRVLVSIEPPASALPGSRPHALRFDPPQASELRDLAGEAERLIGEMCRRALERRTP
jgi:hypothetical protein